MKRLIFFLLPVLLAHAASAQDLTGTWEGTEEGNYMKMVIVKVGNGYVGYTYDVDGGGGWCRANLAGSFDAKEKKFKGSGQGMIAMKGSHVQCVFDLTYSGYGKIERLRGTERTKGSESLLDNIFGFDAGPVELRKVSPSVDTTVYMHRYIADAGPVPPALRKATAAKPAPKPAAKPPAKPVAKSTTANPAPKPVAKATPKASPKPAPKAVTKTPAKAPVTRTAPPVAKTPAVTPQPRTEAPVLPKSKPAPAQPVAGEGLLSLKRQRSSTLVQEIETPAPVITIRVFDNGVPDGDTVSILHNNLLVADHRLVAVNYFEFQVRLDEGDPLHEITLIAHNLGTIAPNTASLTIIAGEERYRLTASTDLGKNAVIRVRYKRP